MPKGRKGDIDMGKKVLVVDDDAMNLKMAEFILEKQGYEISKAHSGMECLIKLQNEPVDLILLDIEMPIMNGIKTLEIIRDNEQFNAIPVMFLTASAEDDVITEAGKRLGVLDYINKPFLPQDLLKAVERACCV